MRRKDYAQEDLGTCSFSILLAPFLVAIVELVEYPDAEMIINVMQK